MKMSNVKLLYILSRTSRCPLHLGPAQERHTNPVKTRCTVQAETLQLAEATSCITQPIRVKYQAVSEGLYLTHLVKYLLVWCTQSFVVLVVVYPFRTRECSSSVSQFSQVTQKDLHLSTAWTTLFQGAIFRWMNDCPVCSDPLWHNKHRRKGNEARSVE